MTDVTGEIDRSSEPLRGYAICATPRSGSNYLCQLLTSTGVLGRPLEYFNGPARRVLGMPDYPDEPELQLSTILRIGRTANGVYGLKLFPRQFHQLQGYPWTEMAPNLSYVLLSRHDLLGQSISWARAIQTEQYRSTSPRVRASRYDGVLTTKVLTEVVREQARWRLWFTRTGITPLRLWYEEVVSAPQAAIHAVADLVGVPRPDHFDARAIDLHIQRDEESEAWRTRFIAENGQRGSVSHEFSRAGIPNAW